MSQSILADAGVTLAEIQLRTTVDPEISFTFLEKIGKGSFGQVFKGMDNDQKKIIAIKIIDLEAAEDEIEDIQKEITVLSQCFSPYVTQYYGSYIKGSKLWIIMEYLGGGSVLDLMKRPGKPGFEEVYIAIILREILKGLSYLHGQGKVHRDIKAANVLLSESGEVKLADFGVAAQLTNTIRKRDTFVGTPYWMAPEVIKQTQYDTKADIWSLGITAIELLKGSPPYADMQAMKVLFIIPKKPPPRVESTEGSKALREFVEKCLQDKSEKRYSADELLRLPFIVKAKKTSLLAELIEKRKRIVTSEGYDSGSESEDEPVNNDQRFEWAFETIKVKPQALAISEMVVENKPKEQYQQMVRAASPLPSPPESVSRLSTQARSLATKPAKQNSTKPKPHKGKPKPRVILIPIRQTANLPPQSYTQMGPAPVMHAPYPNPVSRKFNPIAETDDEPFDNKPHMQYEPDLSRYQKPLRSHSLAQKQSASLSATIIPLLTALRGTYYENSARWLTEVGSAFTRADSSCPGFVDRFVSEIIASMTGPILTREVIRTAINNTHK